MNIPAPFSQRQIDYIKRCKTSWFNVAEGGKRGSKNVLQTYIFCRLLEMHPDKLHLIAGVSSATARLNIADCDGFGIENYFEGRCRKGKYQNRECIYITTATGEKVVLVSGGGKAGDEKLIKGNTYGMAYITEANECHPSFIKEVFDRTISSSDRKIFHDLNPKEPEHPYYTDILQFHEDSQEADGSYGYNYGHFTLADNMSLSDDAIRKILKTYQKGTVWYDRDIKGQRVVAEGIIFRYLAENVDKYLLDISGWYDADGKSKQRYSKLVIGIDFGGNASKTVYILSGYMEGYSKVYPLEEDDLPITEEIGAKEICDKFITFYKKCIDIYGRVDWIFPDSASTTMINSLRAAAREAGLKWQNIAGCRKNEVADRPRLVDELFNTKRLLISPRCPKLTKAIQSLRWDKDHPDIPEDKNIGNCNDYWDAFNYTFLNFVEYIELNR